MDYSLVVTLCAVFTLLGSTISGIVTSLVTIKGIALKLEFTNTRIDDVDETAKHAHIRIDDILKG